MIARNARPCLVDSASCETPTGQSDGAYGLLGAAGTPEAIGRAIACETELIDLSAGDDGPPAVYLDVRIRILRRYLTPTERAALVAAFDEAIEEAKGDAFNAKGLHALTMAHDLGYDWERDDDLTTWALKALPEEGMAETKRRALALLCGES